MRKFQELAGHDFFQAMNLGDAITNLDNCSHFLHSYAGLKVFNLLANNFVNFAGSNCFHDLLYAFAVRVSPQLPASSTFNRSNWLRTDPSNIVDPM